MIVEGDPKRVTAEGIFYARGGVAQFTAQLVMVFEVDDGAYTGFLFDSAEEGEHVVGGGFAIEVSYQENAFAMEAVGFANSLDSFDEAVGLPDDRKFRKVVVVGAEQHALLVGGFEKSSRFGIDVVALAGSCDICLRAIAA